jgi:hypothetical protein
MQTNDSGSLETADCSGAELIKSGNRYSQSIERVGGEPRTEGNTEEVEQ